MWLTARLGAIPVAIVLASACGAAPSSTAAHWSQPTKLSGVRLLRAVSCVSQSFCMAVGGGQAVAYASGSWGRPQTIDSHSDINNGLVTVSCVSASFCAAGDGVGNAFIYNGSRWSSPKLVTTAGLAQVSCGTVTFCGAVDINGDALFYDGSRWSRPKPIPGSSQSLSISCPSAGSCMAMDATGTRAYRLSAGSWSTAGAIQTSEPSGGSEPNVASAVACSSPEFCAALDDFGEAFTWAGGRWSGHHAFDKNLLAGSDAVSCPATTACLAVDENGVATRWNGATWSPKQPIDPGRGGLTDVACGSPRFCVAVDIRGRALIYH